MFGNSQAKAEGFALFAWPVLMSFVALYAAIPIDYVQGGLSASVFTAIIAIPTFQLLDQFANGQIDHHNAQPLLSLTFIAAIVALKQRSISGV